MHFVLQDDPVDPNCYPLLDLPSLLPPWHTRENRHFYEEAGVARKIVDAYKPGHAVKLLLVTMISVSAQ